MCNGSRLFFAATRRFPRQLPSSWPGPRPSRRRCIGGRRPGLSPEAERTAIVAATLYQEQRLSVRDIAESLRISKATSYKYLRVRGVPVYTSRPQVKKSVASRKVK